jgi:hypothetical protein
MHHFALALVLLLGSVHACAASGDRVADAHYAFSSGRQQVDLLELYSSEGCSSCPPAEAWFDGLLERPDLWRRIVPVVFHVDYWNDLGWNDPFSTADNSQRQRRYEREGGVNSVYTPGFVLNGSEWRGWFSEKSLPTGTTPAGLLSVELANGRIEASFDNETSVHEPLELQVALLGFDLTTNVAAGENRGKALIHQFVVLEHTAMLSSNNEWQLEAPQSAVAAQKQALAVWVTRPNTQKPLQATGGWLN